MACATVDSVGPNEATVAGLQLTLVLRPETLSVGQSFNARLYMRNVSGDTVWLGSGSSCLARIGVFRGGDRQSGFEGTDFPCLDIAWRHPVAAGDSAAVTWDLVVGSPGSTPKPGNYAFRAELALGPELVRLEHYIKVMSPT